VLLLAIVNSIVGLVLLSMLVLRGGSGAAASLFFLSPPVTAVMAWLVLDETLSPLQLVGLVVAVIGVGAATRTRSASVPGGPAGDEHHAGSSGAEHLR
jgi:drug/metabolite transporter (DMT)-like permease